MLVIWQAPKLTKLIPAPLAAIAVVTAVVIGFGIEVPRVGDLASLSGGLPPFAIPAVPLTLETLVIIFPYALILAAIGLIESLLTLNLVGDMTEQRGGASRECVAQGAVHDLQLRLTADQILHKKRSRLHFIGIIACSRANHFAIYQQV